MLDVREIMEMALRVEKSPVRKGRFYLHPPVELKYMLTGKIVHVVFVDVHYKYPNNVKVSELDLWCPASDFEIPDDAFMIWSCPNPNCEGGKTGSDCDRYCRKCGTALKKILSFSADNTFCKECKASVFPGNNFCGACGAVMTTEQREGEQSRIS